MLLCWIQYLVAATHLMLEIDIIDVVGEEVDDRLATIERPRKEQMRHFHQDLLAGQNLPHEPQPRHGLVDVLRIGRLQGADDLHLVVDLVQPRLETALFGTDEVAELEHGQVQLRIVIRRVLASRQQLLQNCQTIDTKESEKISPGVMGHFTGWQRVLGK